MTKADISLFFALTVWATLIGAVMYSHIVFFPTYLHHLPESTRLIQGADGIHDERFWILIHPVAILTLLTSLLLNWKATERRKYILITVGIYCTVLVATFAYFVPELMAFAKSAGSGVPAAEWLERGNRWESFSWMRGSFMYLGFLLLLVAVTKKHIRKTSYVKQAVSTWRPVAMPRRTYRVGSSN